MKHLIFIISLIVLLGCKDKKQNENSIKTEDVEQQSEVSQEQLSDNASVIYSNAWVAEIQLNDGNKWQANMETNEGVLQMQNALKTHPTDTIDDYHKLAEQLNETKNYVVKKCTMTGKSHDNLHIWLHPLIEKIDALLKTETVAEAAIIKHSIEENINGYYNYFQ